MTTYYLKTTATYSIVIDPETTDFIVVLEKGYDFDAIEPGNILPGMGEDAFSFLDDLSAITGVGDLAGIYADGGIEGLQAYLAELGGETDLPEGNIDAHLPDGFEEASSTDLADMLGLGAPKSDAPDKGVDAEAETLDDAVAGLLKSQEGYMQSAGASEENESSFWDYVGAALKGAVVGAAYGATAGPGTALAGAAAGAIAGAGAVYVRDAVIEDIEKNYDQFNVDPDQGDATGTGDALVPLSELFNLDPLEVDPETTQPGVDGDADAFVFVDYDLPSDDPADGTTQPDPDDVGRAVPKELGEDDPSGLVNPGEEPADEFVFVVHPDLPTDDGGHDGHDFVATTVVVETDIQIEDAQIDEALLAEPVLEIDVLV